MIQKFTSNVTTRQTENGPSVTETVTVKDEAGRVLRRERSVNGQLLWVTEYKHWEQDTNDDQ